MRRSTRTLVAAFVGTGLASGLAATARAGAFAIREQSAVGQGLDFAGVAAGSAGVASLFWNPATITMQPGWQAEVTGTAVFPFASARPVAGTSPVLLGLGGTGPTGDMLYNAVVPSGNLTYEVNNRLWLGLGLNSPYGAMTKDPANYAGQIYGRTTDVRTYDFNPTVAFKLTDWLSIGAGAEAEFMQLRLTQAVSPLPDAPSATMRGDSWGFGFTAGATLTPRAGTELGVGYRSSVAEHLDGTLRVDGLPSIPAVAPVRLPDQVTVGLRQDLTPDLTLDVGYEWTRWSRLGTVTIHDPVAAQTLSFDYTDGSAVSLGGSYKWNSKLTFRSGIGYEWSPISLVNRDIRSPDGDRISVSAGVGYQVTDRLSVDLAYSHCFAVGDTRILMVPGSPQYLGLPLVASVSVNTDVASLGLTYRW